MVAGQKVLASSCRVLPLVRKIALVEPGAAAVDAPSGVADADSHGGHGGQQQQQVEGQDEPLVQAGVLEGGEGGDGDRVAGQGDGD
jgi:hypothetical protein